MRHLSPERDAHPAPSVRISSIVPHLTPLTSPSAVLNLTWKERMIMETDAFEEQLRALDQQRKLNWLAALRHDFENPHELAEWVGPNATLVDLGAYSKKIRPAVQILRRAEMSEVQP